MYVPAPFAENRPDVLRAFVRDHPFATLVSTTADGEPFASHLPLLLDEDEGPHGTLLGHLARPNEQADHLAAGRPVLAVFHGPHAYVSPRWYQSAPAVPTWNYAVVHARGNPRRIDDPSEVRALLDRTTRAFEPADGGWTPDGLPDPYLAAMTGGIVGFAVRITQVRGKFKLLQNRPAADRNGAIAALTLGTPEERATADVMRSWLARV